MWCYCCCCCCYWCCCCCYWCYLPGGDGDGSGGAAAPRTHAHAHASESTNQPANQPTNQTNQPTNPPNNQPTDKATHSSSIASDKLNESHESVSSTSKSQSVSNTGMSKPAAYLCVWHATPTKRTTTHNNAKKRSDSVFRVDTDSTHWVVGSAAPDTLLQHWSTPVVMTLVRRTYVHRRVPRNEGSAFRPLPGAGKRAVLRVHQPLRRVVHVVGLVVDVVRVVPREHVLLKHLRGQRNPRAWWW